MVSVVFPWLILMVSNPSETYTVLLEAWSLTCRVSITGELVRNAYSRARLRSTGSVFLEVRPSILSFAVPPGDSDTGES